MKLPRVLGLLAPVALIGLTAFALAASRTAPPAKPATVLQEPSQDGPVQAELLTVHSMGFDPAEIARPPGPFLLVVENRSGVELGTLQLLPVDESSQQTGAPLLEVSIGKDQPNWSQRVELSTGGYVLKQVDEPGWSCKITITP